MSVPPAGSLARLLLRMLRRRERATLLLARAAAATAVGPPPWRPLARVCAICYRKPVVSCAGGAVGCSPRHASPPPLDSCRRNLRDCPLAIVGIDGRPGRDHRLVASRESLRLVSAWSRPLALGLSRGLYARHQLQRAARGAFSSALVVWIWRFSLVPSPAGAAHGPLHNLINVRPASSGATRCDALRPRAPAMPNTRARSRLRRALHRCALAWRGNGTATTSCRLTARLASPPDLENHGEARLPLLATPCGVDRLFIRWAFRRRGRAHRPTGIVDQFV